MKKSGNTAAVCEQLAQPVAEALGVTLWDTVFEKEGAGWYLRYYIDKEDGVDIDDCEDFSRRMSDLLDERDPIEQSYCLEVSSPGVERTLRKEEHFRWALGKTVSVKLFAPKNGSREFVGMLTLAEPERICIEDEAGAEHIFDMKEISSARIYEAFF